MLMWSLALINEKESREFYSADVLSALAHIPLFGLALLTVVIALVFLFGFVTRP